MSNPPVRNKNFPVKIRHQNWVREGCGSWHTKLAHSSRLPPLTTSIKHGQQALGCYLGARPCVTKPVVDLRFSCALSGSNAASSTDRLRTKGEGSTPWRKGTCLWNHRTWDPWRPGRTPGALLCLFCHQLPQDTDTVTESEQVRAQEMLAFWPE